MYCSIQHVVFQFIHCLAWGFANGVGFLEREYNLMQINSIRKVFKFYIPILGITLNFTRKCVECAWILQKQFWLIKIDFSIFFCWHRRCLKMTRLFISKNQKVVKWKFNAVMSKPTAIQHHWRQHTVFPFLSTRKKLAQNNWKWKICAVELAAWFKNFHSRKVIYFHFYHQWISTQ